MKTTSSKLTRGVMLIAALLVPATAWWAGFHYYNASREAESREQLARLQEIQEKHAETVKDNQLLKEAIQNEGKRRQLFKSMEAGTTEFVLETKPRSTWNWPTDPDHVWQEQRRQASEMLIRLNATDLPPSRPSPFHRRIPAPSRQK